MRVTFVLPTLGLSGGARVVAIYAKALAVRGHQVVLVSPPESDIPLWSKVKAFVKGRGSPSMRVANETHLDGLGLDHRILESPRPIVGADVPDGDVVIATWFKTAEWVNALDERKGAKVYFIQHHEVNEVLPYLPANLGEATYKLPLHKIVVSPWLKDIMRTRYGDAIVDLVPNSVDRTQFFAPARGKQSVPTVGFMYSSAPFKGVDLTLEALSTIRPQYRALRVICFGSEQPGSGSALPVGADFHFRPPQDRIRDLYAQCDAWIVASRSEGFGLPAMEAMACRTPVVATRTGWAAEAIESGKNGVLVDVGDVRGLARGVGWLLSLSDDAWRAVSANAYETVALSSWEASAEMFERALEHACRRSKKGEIAGKCGAV